MGNTVAGVEQGRVTTVSWRAEAPSLYAPNGCRKYLNHAERQRALAAMTLLKSDQALFALTLAWTGARVSEILALTPSSFQLESGTVAIQTLKRRKHCVREVPIPPALMTELDRTFGIALAQRNSESSHRHLWPWCRSTAWRIIKRVMHQSGIIGSHACPRGLRHAFGVGTLQASVPITLVQRWLGHARLSTTAIYVDASGPEETAFAKRFWEAAA